MIKLNNAHRAEVFLVVLGLLILFPEHLIGQDDRANKGGIIKPRDFAHYIQYFNRIDDESIQNYINNEECWDWMLENIPWFECPDKEIEEIYYYRWWVYRKHIRHTPKGYVITEFLPEVGHAQKYNTIACAAGLHIEEGRWLRNREYISDYIKFWFSEEANPHQYSNWLANAVFNYCSTIGEFELGNLLLKDLVKYYHTWETSNQHHSNLFWSNDDRDGGEYSISGSGLRPTLNSYMYGNAVAISKIANKLAIKDIGDEFEKKSNDLKTLVQSSLWDSDYQFFNTYSLESRDIIVENLDFKDLSDSVRVREIYGYLPWKFLLPTMGYEQAWGQMLSRKGFLAPYGPTTAEQRHPLFMKNRIKRCQWDGSSWPFATSLTIGAVINLLRHYDQNIINQQDFFELLKIYTGSHRRSLPYGEQIPWIGESLHPTSGIWLSRAIALDMKIPIIKERSLRDMNHAILRGKDYNHSSYCDLIISGIVGLEFGDNGQITVDPLLPEDTWRWFCLDGIEFAGKALTIIYDETGEKYNQPAGLSVFVNGERIGYSKKLTALMGDINGLNEKE